MIQFSNTFSPKIAKHQQAFKMPIHKAKVCEELFLILLRKVSGVDTSAAANISKKEMVDYMGSM